MHTRTVKQSLNSKAVTRTLKNIEITFQIEIECNGIVALKYVAAYKVIEGKNQAEAFAKSATTENSNEICCRGTDVKECIV